MLTLLIAASLTQTNAVFDPQNGHYYERVDANISWTRAMSEAKNRFHLSYQGHLATLSTPEENEFVIKNLGGEKLKGHWLGAFKQFQGKQIGWRWITGEVATYLPFGPGEPNNNGGNEDVLQFHFTGQFGHGLWNDLPHDETKPDRALGYVVEYEPPIALLTGP